MYSSRLFNALLANERAMKIKRTVLSVFVTFLALFGAQPFTLALPERSAQGILPENGGTFDSSGKKADEQGSRKIRISPEALKQLSPEQQQIIQQRLQAGGNKSSMPSSSETKALSPAEAAGNADSLTPALEAAPSAQPEELSDYERTFSQASELSKGLRQYGYGLFSGVPTTFAPVDDIPVPDDYRIAPGDEIIISALSPRRSGDYSLIVNRNGTIFYPNIGTLSVAGMTFSKMNAFLTQKIKGGAVDMRLSIRMGKLRTIKVFVVGRVKKPGAYTISSLSNLSNALMACGGPTKNGSLRDVQLKRSGRTIARFDFYDFLMKGNSASDFRLESGDVLFIPEIGPVVGIAGNVKEPGIYELKGKTSLAEALKMAGNVTAMGFTQQIQIDRYFQNQAKTTVDIDLAKLKEKGRLPIQDGDLIKVFSVNSKLLNTVYLEGNVQRPGKYAYKPNLRVRDVIKDEHDLKPESYLDFALIERAVRPDFHTELIPFHLGKALSGDPVENKRLNPDDTVRVYYRWDIQSKPLVRITGAVHSPGEFLLRPQMTLLELIHLAGGIKDSADLAEAELTRVQVVDNQMKTQHLKINLERILGGQENVPLLKDDYLLVKTVPEYKLYRTITLAGEVAQPGTYTFQDNERLSDLIQRAGGLTKRAYPKGSIFSRLSVRKLQEERLQEIVRKLEADIYRNSAQEIGAALSVEAAKANQEALAAKKQLLESIKQTKSSGRLIVDVARLLDESNSASDIQLEDGDVLLVPPIINSVSVLGQVYNPTAITYEKERTVDFYLAKTGNPTENADQKGIYVIKADGSVLTDKNFQTGWFFWRRGVRSAKLEPGDTIVVPEQVAENTSIRDIKDITQILFQIATSAGITWGMIKK